MIKILLRNLLLKNVLCRERLGDISLKGMAIWRDGMFKGYKE